MIEINLLSDGRGGSAGRSRISSPGWGSRGLDFDGWVVGSGLLVVGAIVLSVHLWLGVSDEESVLQAALEQALADSIEAAALNEAWREAERRHALIAARISTIEDIDARRYDWPHILEEIAIALPESAWIVRIEQTASDEDGFNFRVEGRAGDNFTLTRFWNALEASFFIRDVRLLRTENLAESLPDADPDAGSSYLFVLEAASELPPQEVLELDPFAEVAT